MLYHLTRVYLILQICEVRTTRATPENYVLSNRDIIITRTIETKEAGGGKENFFGPNSGLQQAQGSGGYNDEDMHGWLNERKGWFGYKSKAGGDNGNNQKPVASGGTKTENNGNFFQKQKQKFIGKKSQEALDAAGIKGPMAVGAQGMIQQTMNHGQGNYNSMSPRAGLLAYLFAPLLSVLDISGFKPRPRNNQGSPFIQ